MPTATQLLTSMGKNFFLNEVREVVKKPGYFTVRLTVRGGGNPYGQPDRKNLTKISVFFDDFPEVFFVKIISDSVLSQDAGQ